MKGVTVDMLFAPWAVYTLNRRMTSFAQSGIEVLFPSASHVRHSSV